MFCDDCEKEKDGLFLSICEECATEQNATLARLRWERDVLALNQGMKDPPISVALVGDEVLGIHVRIPKGGADTPVRLPPGDRPEGAGGES